MAVNLTDMSLIPTRGNDYSYLCTSNKAKSSIELISIHVKNILTRENKLMYVGTYMKTTTRIMHEIERQYSKQ